MGISKRLRLIFNCVIYLFFSILTALISRSHFDLHLADSVIPAQSICGIISVILILFCVSMTLSCHAAGFVLSLILNSFSILSATLSIAQTGSLDPLPGICIMLCGIIIVCVVYHFVKRIALKEDELLVMANTDILTELPNRRGFLDYLDKLMKSELEEPITFAVAFVDLDNFKNINDAMGHPVGDVVLQQIVKRWKDIVSEHVFISRQGGDEFAFIVTGLKTEDELITEVSRYITALSERIDIKETHFYLTASVGIALYPEHGPDASNLLRYADMAMYHAKKEGRNKVALYNKKIMQDTKHEIEMETAIRDALWNNHFFLDYQPQYDIIAKKLRGFECLVRMINKDGEVVGPGKFITLAERTSFILDIERFVFHHAMSDFLPIINQYPDILLSINVSVSHLMHDEFIHDLSKALQDTGFPPNRLEIEITESVLIASADRAVEVLTTLKSMGISIALDDFGTGYASLSYLAKLPIDLLKIDKTFIDSLNEAASSGNGKSGKDFVAAIISMGHVLHYDVLSEGVEEEEQLDILKNLGCDHLQGFLWGKPMSFENVKTLCCDVFHNEAV